MAGAATGALQRGLSGAATLPREVVAVVCPDNHPALEALPRSLAEFVVGSDVASLDPKLLPLARALVVLPFSPACVASAGELLRGGHAPRIEWVHCYTAGVDSLSSFIAGPLREANLPLTNGRSAFSSSLAEYALHAALHFTKKVPRCQANRAAKVWDRFRMPVLRGQTMGLLGYGDIAKHTARLAKAFGMRVIALRRNAVKEDKDGLLDMTLGPYAGPILPAHKVCAISRVGPFIALPQVVLSVYLRARRAASRQGGRPLAHAALSPSTTPPPPIPPHSPLRCPN